MDTVRTMLSIIITQCNTILLIKGDINTLGTRAIIDHLILN